MKSKQNGQHFADNIFKCIFLKENFFILIKILQIQLTLLNIGLGNGLVPIREQAITWTNADQDMRHHMVWLSHNELNLCSINIILAHVN